MSTFRRLIYAKKIGNPQRSTLIFILCVVASKKGVGKLQLSALFCATHDSL